MTEHYFSLVHNNTRSLILTKVMHNQGIEDQIYFIGLLLGLWDKYNIALPKQFTFTLIFKFKTVKLRKFHLRMCFKYVAVAHAQT